MGIFRKTIELCPNCKKPLVWTFMYAGNEWYCLNCKNSYPMFCDSISIEENDEDFKYYELQQRIYKNIFKVIEKDLVPKRCYRNKCKKCESRQEYHYQHLTDLEKLKDRVARETLKTIKFNKR